MDILSLSGNLGPPLDLLSRTVPLGDESCVFNTEEATTSAPLVSSFASLSRLTRVVAGVQ